VRRRAALALALSSTGLLFAAPALADGEITAAPTGDRFSSSSFAIDQGEKTNFRNSDIAVSHNVVANTTEGGKPLFESDVIDAGASGPVRGTEFLVTGSYPFRCTLHPGMDATLVVSSAGTPQPKPGAPGDTTPAEAKVAISDSKIAAVYKRKALKVKATTNEAAKFAFTAKSGSKTIATGSADVADAKSVSLKLNAAGRKLFKRARKVKVTLTAAVSDGAGNASSASATRTLKR
jgi:plastocyanin